MFKDFYIRSVWSVIFVMKAHLPLVASNNATSKYADLVLNE
jgi:hypothetical protein